MAVKHQWSFSNWCGFSTFKEQLLKASEMEPGKQTLQSTVQGQVKVQVPPSRFLIVMSVKDHMHMAWTLILYLRCDKAMWLQILLDGYFLSEVSAVWHHNCSMCPRDIFSLMEHLWDVQDLRVEIKNNSVSFIPSQLTPFLAFIYPAWSNCVDWLSNWWLR